MGMPVVDVFRDAIGVVIRLAAPMLLLSIKPVQQALLRKQI